jgi:putative hydrolase of the HAD superfamily
MAVRAVIFDIGGVLEITPDLGVGARWERKFGFEPGQMDELLNEVWEAGATGLLTEAQVYAQVKALLPVPPEEVDAMMAELWVQYLGEANHEMMAFARSLRPGYKVALLSNSFVGAREREQARYGLEDLCDLIVYSHEVGLSKPDPRIFQLTCERLGVAPEETVFVDDHEHHVLAARRLGMHAVLFKGAQQAIAGVRACLGE